MSKIIFILVLSSCALIAEAQNRVSGNKPLITCFQCNITYPCYETCQNKFCYKQTTDIGGERLVTRGCFDFDEPAAKVGTCNTIEHTFPFTDARFYTNYCICDSEKCNSTPGIWTATSLLMTFLAWIQLQ